MFCLQSRVHPLRSFPPMTWIKRDDELGFGTSGCKLRKWSSLLPALIERQITDAIVEGGPRSNNCVVAAQLLRQAGIKPHFAFRQHRQRAGNGSESGNRLLMELLTNPDEVTWLGPIDELAYQDWLQQRLVAWSQDGRRGSVIPEGASCLEALSGAMTLADDIVRNEQNLQLSFGKIFVDSGTALTAVACMLRLAKYGRRPQFEIVVVAGDEQSFCQTLNFYQKILGEESSLPPYRLHRPLSGVSFGSVTADNLAFVKRFVRDEGVLVDPIYTGKLFQKSYALLADERPREPSLIIHSGGGTGLFGFASQLLRP